MAEDNTLVRELLVAFLLEHGANVIVANDGPSALTVVRANHPDVLLLDIALPGLDGIAVATDLRRAGSSLRIIGLSAHASPHDESRARAAGMDEFFTKPVSLSRLAETLARRPGNATSVDSRGDIVDPRLRARLAADFANETPRLLDELHAAWTVRDWTRLRDRAHYLNNSADILGNARLQEACRRLASIDDSEPAARVRERLDAVADAIPERAFASAECSPADLK